MTERIRNKKLNVSIYNLYRKENISKNSKKNNNILLCMPRTILASLLVSCRRHFVLFKINIEKAAFQGKRLCKKEAEEGLLSNALPGSDNDKARHSVRSAASMYRGYLVL